MQRDSEQLRAELKRLAEIGRVRAAGYLRELADLAVPPGGQSVGEPRPRRVPGGRYGKTWNPPTEQEALKAIYNTDDESTFEEGGRVDYKRLKPYFDEKSVVLDLGCGIGRIARFVAPECRSFYAVDVSARMLELARERLSHCQNVTYVQGEDTSFPSVPSESVDLAYSMLVLQHVEREDAFLLLEELRRVIKPTGTVVLTFPNLLSDGYLKSFLDYAHSGASTQPNRARAYTPQEVERLLPAAGFSVEIDAETEIRVVGRPIA